MRVVSKIPVRKRYFSLHVDEGSREAAVFIFGDIVEWELFDSDVSSHSLVNQIKDLDVDRINVYINSYGGEVAEALAIYNQLRRHKAKIVTHCDGFACSAASVVFMAGDERVMCAASMLCIHNALTPHASGDAAALRKKADDLEAITEASKQAYLAHVSIDEDELTALMDTETWIGAEAAVQKGFATMVEPAKESDKPSQSLRAKIVRALTTESDSGIVADITAADLQAWRQVMVEAVEEIQRARAQAAPDSEPQADPEPEAEENRLKSMFAAWAAKGAKRNG